MRKHILVLTNELSSVNGRATTGYELCKGLQTHYDLTVLTYTNAQNDPTLRATVLPILTSSREKMALNAVQVLWQLRIPPVDVVFCNMEEALPLAILLKWKFRCNALLIGQGTYIYYPFVTSAKRHIARWLLRQLDVLIVPSRYTHDKVREFYQGKIEIINWGVNLERFHPIADIPKEQAFVFVGELKARKGVRPLFEAFERLLREFPDLKLYMIGGTQAHSNVIDGITIPANVRLLGEIRDTRILCEYYSRSLAHVLPSVNTGNSFEGFGIVHVEANACGIPSIGSRDCGNEDAIVDGVTGFLCPQQDVDGLYTKMKCLVTDTALRERMGNAAFAFAQQHTWQAASHKLMTVIEQVTS